MKLFFKIFIFFIFTPLHKYYLSTTEIFYNEKKKSIEIISNFHIDDLQTSLSSFSNSSVSLDIENGSSKDEKRILINYFKNHFILNGIGDDTEFEFVGWEFDNQFIKIYIAINKINDFNFISCTNTLLIDEFPEQKNIVNVNFFKKKSSYLLDYNKRKVIIFNSK